MIIVEISSASKSVLDHHGEERRVPFQLPSFFSQVKSKSGTVICMRLSTRPPWTSTLLDYEICIINSKEVLGNQTVVQECLVHWKRCFRRKVQELGLVEIINHNQEVVKWIRSWSVKKLVPVEEIDNVGAFLPSTMILSCHLRILINLLLKYSPLIEGLLLS